MLSEGTVRNHLSAAIGKLGAANRAEAVQIATDNGWLELSKGGRPPLNPPRRANYTRARGGAEQGGAPLNPPRQFLDVAEDRSRCPRGAIA